MCPCQMRTSTTDVQSSGCQDSSSTSIMWSGMRLTSSRVMRMLSTIWRSSTVQVLTLLSGLETVMTQLLLLNFSSVRRCWQPGPLELDLSLILKMQVFIEEISSFYVSQFYQRSCNWRSPVSPVCYVGGSLQQSSAEVRCDGQLWYQVPPDPQVEEV